MSRFDALIDIAEAYENGEMDEKSYKESKEAELKWLETGEY